jgi:hypothetical protein
MMHTSPTVLVVDDEPRLRERGDRTPVLLVNGLSTGADHAAGLASRC